MKQLRQVTGKVAVLDRPDVDTDQIIPKQFLKRIERTGFGEFLFYDWRYTSEGRPDPSFVLNEPRYRGASVLVAGRNFGCGSSREHAPLAIRGAGMPVVLAESFARIFYRNAINVGLPILEVADVSKKVKEGDVLEVDLLTGRVHNTTSGETMEAVPLSDKALSILRAGGLVEVTKQKLAERAKAS